MAWSKYHAHKAEIDGIVFDSAREANRWRELKMLEQAGEISGLQRQVSFVLIPTYREPDELGPRGGMKKGKLIQKECVYVADFVYMEGGKKIVEDVKGYRTKEYAIKKKLMYDKYRIRIRET